jgi:predicted amidohydrolase
MLKHSSKFKKLLYLFCLLLPVLAYSNEIVRVATVQFHSKPTVAENTKIITNYLTTCAENEIDIVLFPECATTGYDKKVINNASRAELLDAEKTIAKACADNKINAVVGTVYDSVNVRYNTAAVFNRLGDLVHRYAKIQLVGGDDWAVPGTEMCVFHLDGIPCSIIICHDERYPELVRLPVLAGAQIVFYPSSESNVTAEHKLDPYRAQISARADENDIFIIQSNFPAMMSHGQSRIISPWGIVLQEASMFKEEMTFCDIDLSKAGRGNAKNSLRYKALKNWWKQGMDMVKIKP